MLDTKALAQSTALIVRELLNETLSPVMARLEALEHRAAIVPERGEPGVPGEPGRDGTDIDVDHVRGMLADLIAEAVPDAVAAAVLAIPVPERGEKGDPGADGTPGEKGEPGRDGQDGKDGTGLAGMMIDREGEAIATLTNGKMIKLGPVVGRDGTDGTAGVPGRDGRDGQDLTDIQVTQDGAVIELAFHIGETRSIYEIELPAGPPGSDGKDAYTGEARGLYTADETYRKMDVVSFNGSEWRAKCDDPGELPGPNWMLSACKGKRGDRGERGVAGKDGVSPIAQYLRGSELVTTLSDGAELMTDLQALGPN